MEIEGVSTKSAILHRNWYNGTEIIHVLVFFACRFQIIEENAFTTFAFVMLRELKILYMEIVFQPGWANGLNYLNVLNVAHTMIINMKKNFLVAFQPTIMGFFCEGATNYIEFHDLFGHITLPKLSHIGVHFYQARQSGQKDHILTSQSFIGLVAINIMDISYCGIIAIVDNTFNAISKTLRDLNIANNKLIQVSINWFHIFFNNRSFDTKNEIRRLCLLNNPFEVDWEFFKLRNFSIINSMVEVYLSENLPYYNMNSSPPDNEKWQFIRSRDYCFRHEQFNVFTQPLIKFNVFSNSSGHFIRLESTIITAFKLIQLEVNVRNTNTGCLDSNMNLKCMSLTNGTTDIPRMLHETVNLTSFLIIFYSTSIWPLNYHTIKTQPYDTKNKFGWKWTPMLIICVTLLYVASAAFFLWHLIWLFERRKSPKLPMQRNKCN